VTDAHATRPRLRTILAIGGMLIVIIAVVAFYKYRESWPRGEALCTALAPLILGQASPPERLNCDQLKPEATEQAQVARAILGNYIETRKNASRWSGIHWGFTFLAAALSALAGLLLKLESVLKDEKIKKDVASVLAVTAAILITISTSGDFGRKWQANRIAAAELEKLGYEFLGKNGENPREYFDAIAQILHKRHLGIVGSMDQVQSE
jgi:hypothetical protein